MQNKFDLMVEAFKAYVQACADYEEESGIRVCSPSWIQLNEGGRTSPFRAAIDADAEIVDRGPNGKHHSFGFMYGDVDVNWLVGGSSGGSS